MAESTDSAPYTIGLVLFDQAEELDWVGPFEVFTMAREVAAGKGPAADIRVVLISQDGAVVQGAKGMRVEVDYSFSDAPALDCAYKLQEYAGRQPLRRRRPPPPRRLLRRAFRRQRFPPALLRR